MSKRWLVLALALAVVAAVALGGKAWWDRAHRTELSRALDHLPADAMRVSFTDWAAVRRALHVRTVTDPDPADVAAWLSRAYDKDYSSASSIDASASALQQHYGISPGNLGWEAYTQSRAGAATVLRPIDDVDLDTVASHLTKVGYAKPGSATGVWRGGGNLVAALDPTLTPEVQYVVLLRDQHLVVTSDTAAYAARAARAARGQARSLADVDSVRRMADTLTEPTAAVMWTRDFACEDLAMSQADADGQAQARQLVADAGKVSPLAGLTMALSPDRELTVAEQFESGEQARENLRARARLAVGPAVGRGEATFADDFKLTSSRTQDATVLLRMRARDPSAFVLSALYDGPVLFATC